jgi:hypothetical protein
MFERVDMVLEIMQSGEMLFTRIVRLDIIQGLAIKETRSFPCVLGQALTYNESILCDRRSYAPGKKMTWKKGGTSRRMTEVSMLMFGIHILFAALRSE